MGAFLNCRTEIIGRSLGPTLYLGDDSRCIVMDSGVSMKPVYSAHAAPLEMNGCRERDNQMDQATVLISL